MRAIAVLLVLAAVAAGCVTPPDAAAPVSTPSPLAFVDPIVHEHDHASFEEHNFSTPSMSLVAHHPLGEDSKPFSYIGEMDTHENLTVVQVVGRGSVPGFVVLDMTDPTAPNMIGRAEMPFSYVVDVKFSPDGKSVFAASQVGAQRSRAHSPATENPEMAILTGNGFTQWDVSDPTNPIAVAGGLSEPDGCHMLSVKELAGKLTVFCVASTIHIFQYADGGAWTQVGVLGPTGPTGVPDAVQETLATGAGIPQNTRNVKPHDVTVMEDPLEPGRWIALVSYWDVGLHLYEVTDPASPQLLGSWAGAGATVYEGNVHGAALATLDGKRVIVAGPELITDTLPALWVLDASNLAAPAFLAEWVPPGNHTTQGLLLTVHQFQVVQERIYLAYNHAGVWVLDLAAIVDGSAMATEARAEVLGYYLPHEEVELYDSEHAAVPDVWDLNVKDGYIFASDRYTGFYVLRYEGDAPGDANVTSAT